MKPYFRAISKDLEVAEGRGARFDAIVAGKPNPDVTWIKDGHLMTSNRNYSVVVNEKGVNSLIIHTTTMKDAGTYQCTASNKAGQDWFKVTLKVLRKLRNAYLLCRIVVTTGKAVTKITLVEPVQKYIICAV